MNKTITTQETKTFIGQTGLSAFRSTKNIVFLAVMGAIAIVLGYYTIQIGDIIKIGFSGIPNQIIASLFGPVVTGIFNGVMDVIKYVIKPTGAFFPGFTISAIAGGIIYGIALWNKKITLPRILITKLIVIEVVDLLMNTLWITMLYGKGFFAILPMRIVKNVIMWPINSVILYFVLTRLKGVWKQIIK